MKLLVGKVAIVTGAGRGLGRAHALALASAGARVVVNDLGSDLDGTGTDADPVTAVAAEIMAAGGEAIANGASVSDWRSAKSIVDTADRLDIVVNNAGIATFGAIGALDPSAWDAVIAVNLTGSAAVMHWAAAHWMEVGPARGVRLSTPRRPLVHIHCRGCRPIRPRRRAWWP